MLFTVTSPSCQWLKAKSAVIKQHLKCSGLQKPTETTKPCSHLSLGAPLVSVIIDTPETEEKVTFLFILGQITYPTKWAGNPTIYKLCPELEAFYHPPPNHLTLSKAKSPFKKHKAILFAKQK